MGYKVSGIASGRKKGNFSSLPSPQVKESLMNKAQCSFLISLSQSRYKRLGSVKNFKNSQSYSNCAFGWTIACIIYTLLWAVILTAICLLFFSGYFTNYRTLGGCRLCHRPAKGYCELSLQTSISS